MKKLKKLLSLLLALTMVLGMVNLSAFAAEEGETEQAPTETRATYCEKEEHTHTDVCYKLTCTKDEVEPVEGHTHTDECYNMVETLGDYTCGEEHEHTDTCRRAESTYTRGELKEAHDEVEAVEGHTHTIEGGCYELTCTTEEHTHSEACYFGIEKDGGTFTISGTGEFTGKGIFISEDFKTGSYNFAKGTEVDINSMGYGLVQKVIFNEGITAIGTSAFDQGLGWCHQSMEEVVLPQSLTSIGDKAFFQCYILKTINLEHVTSIGKKAFGQNTAMTELTVPAGITEIGELAFGEMKGLENLTISEGVTSIGTQAFYQCTALKTAVFPTTLKKIGNMAFDNCTTLDTIGAEKGVVHIQGVDSIGNQAFNSCIAMKNLVIANVDKIGQKAFLLSKLETVALKNVKTVSSYAFQKSKNLKSVCLEQVNTIGARSFMECAALESVTGLDEAELIDGFAFYNCPKLTGLTIENATKMGFNGNYADVMDRVQKILAGEFKLDAAPDIVDLTPDTGWEDPKVAQSDSWKVEGREYDNQTQLMEQARWINESKTQAEVKVDAYYTGKQQMDYIFVADLSASMAQLGNSKDENARFYDMQSKLLDMTSQLLGSDGYDCRVAVVTFGHQDKTVGNTKFMTDADVAMGEIQKLAPLYENTDYGFGMGEAYKLAKANKGRNTVVIFLSDGAPNSNNSGDQNGTGMAKMINKLGVPIYGVLHSAPVSQHDTALAKMQAICGKNTVFESTDTKSFGKAMNDAFTAVYGDHTVTIPVNSAFEKVTNLTTSNPDDTVTVKDGIITWTITGMPFTKHTLTYKMSLTAENAGKYGEQKYLVNSGNAEIADGASVESPELTRTVNQPSNPGPSIPPTNPPTTDIPDENPPLANVDDRLNTTDHFAYVIGYPDGEVKPEQNITRAEAVTIFYRLMIDSYRTEHWSTTNSYPDADADAWYNCAISTATKAGIFEGDAEGTARPDDPITRAEFAALAARFISDKITDDGVGDFSDTKDHWAAKEIRLAAKAGWITGVGGGKFEPDRYINRAEVMTLVNRMLDRIPDKDHMLSDMKKWPDNMDTSAWFYEAVQEATNDHDYEPIEDTLTEQWTKMMAPKDWITLEKGWIANNGANPEGK